MTDFDKEFELLKEWLNYRTEWMIDYYLNYYNPKQCIEDYLNTGYFIINNPKTPLYDFEEWKLIRKHSMDYLFDRVIQSMKRKRYDT